MSFLIGYTIPKGRAVIRHENRKDWLDNIKKLWKTVDYAIEDVELPEDLDAEGMLNFVDEQWLQPVEIIHREELIETGMI